MQGHSRDTEFDKKKKTLEMEGKVFWRFRD
jgi:hypothetical protein